MTISSRLLPIPSMIFGTYKTVLAVLFLTTGALVFIQGCQKISIYPQTQIVSSSITNICNIAILPFQNTSEYKRGGVVYYRILMSELNRSTGLKVSQEGDIRAEYRKMHLAIGQNPSFDQIKILTDRLNVDALVMGEIIEMKDTGSRNILAPNIAVHLTLTEAHNGKIILTTYHKRSGEDFRKLLHFGVVSNITELAKAVSEEIITEWKAKGLFECSE